jgi:hypothetical protein
VAQIKLFSLIALLLIMPGFSQTEAGQKNSITDADIQLLRSDVQADKNEIIAHTMDFSDSESKVFWPLYRDYARDQQAIGDERVQLIRDYAEHFGSLDDGRAKDISQRLLGVEAKYVELRQQYWPKFEKALGAKLAAKFYQVDNRLSLLVNLKLASEIPLVR